MLRNLYNADFICFIDEEARQKKGRILAIELDSYLWSPTGVARGTLLHAQVGRHPGQTLAHSSTGKARGLLLPG